MEKKGHNLRVVPGSPADLSERDNDSLMLLARGGLDGAFDALVRRHQTRTLRIAAKYLGQSAVAKDVAQNTFLEIHRALPRYKARGRFESYLYRVLLNQCRMASRAARNAARAQTLLDRPVEVEDPLAEQLILERERRREVEQALGRLSGKLREVLVLRFVGELSYREIAEALGLPLGTVKRRIFDGLEKLRRNLEAER
jgi:RNA polymerase sigma-70 factor (ECF subfamily)